MHALCSTLQKQEFFYFPSRNSFLITLALVHSVLNSFEILVAAQGSIFLEENSKDQCSADSRTQNLGTLPRRVKLSNTFVSTIVESVPLFPVNSNDYS